MSKAKTVKSLSVGEIFDKKTAKEHINKPVCCFAGVIYSSFVNLSKYGESVGFKGDIIATNYLTGEVFESDACFLPKNLTAELERKLAANQGGEVEFMAEIRAIASDKNTQGYAWIADVPQTKERMNRKKELIEKATKFFSEKKLLTAPAENGKKKSA